MPAGDREEAHLVEARRLAAAAFSEEKQRYSADAKHTRRRLRDSIHAFEAHFDQLDQKAKSAIVRSFREHGVDINDHSLIMILNYAHVYFREQEGSKVLKPHAAATRILLEYWREHVRLPSQSETLSLNDVYGEPAAPSALVEWIGDELLRIDSALIEKGQYGAGHWRAAFTILLDLRNSNGTRRSDARLPD